MNTENTVNNEVATAAPEGAEVGKKVKVMSDGGFAVDATKLCDMLAWANRITRNSGNTLTVLRSVLFCTTKSGIDIGAWSTNLDEYLCYDLTYSPDSKRKVLRYGKNLVAISMTDLENVAAMKPDAGTVACFTYKIVKSGPKDCDLDASATITVTVCGASVVHTCGQVLEPGQFPPVPEVGERMETHLGDAAAAFIKASKVISEDETRRDLTKVCFDTINGTVTATDARILYTCDGLVNNLPKYPAIMKPKPQDKPLAKDEFEDTGVYTVPVMGTALKLMADDASDHLASVVAAEKHVTEKWYGYDWFTLRSSRHPAVLYVVKTGGITYPNYNQFIPGGGIDNFKYGVLVTPDDVAVMKRLVRKSRLHTYTMNVGLEEGNRVSCKVRENSRTGNGSSAKVVLKRGEWYIANPSSLPAGTPPAEGATEPPPFVAVRFTVDPAYLLIALSEYGMERLYVNDGHSPLYFERRPSDTSTEKVVLMPLRIS